jgi:hypothetical protein
MINEIKREESEGRAIEIELLIKRETVRDRWTNDRKLLESTIKTT